MTGSELKMGGHKMSPELEAAIERARHHIMTPEEKFEQRVSFVFGQQDYDNPNPRTKDEIREALIASMGRPACPVCASRTHPPEYARLIEAATAVVDSWDKSGGHPVSGLINIQRAVLAAIKGTAA